MSQIRLTNKPCRGDAALGVLGTNDVVFATQESVYAAGGIDEKKYEYLGPVLRRRGSEVLYMYGNTASYPNYKWSERYSFRLTGYTLDGTAQTGVLSIREASNWNTPVSYTVSYNASTVDALVEQLNAFFRDTANSVFQTQDWQAVKESDGTVTLHFAYTAWQQASNTGTGGFTLTANFLPESIATANILRRHGGAGGEGAISSWYRALSYFRSDNNSTTYNPTSPVTSVKRGYPICLPGYLGTSQYSGGDQCAFLRSIYGEGEQGWLKFMESCLPVSPCDYGNMGMTDGKARTQYLARQTYTSQQKTTATPVCPAAYYCANLQTLTQPKGTFWLPTTDEVQALLSDIRYPSHGDNKSDPVNRMQTFMNKANISNGSFIWSCLRYSAGNAWYAYGNYGFFYNGGMYNTGQSIPVSLYRL